MKTPDSPIPTYRRLTAWPIQALLLALGKLLLLPLTRRSVDPKLHTIQNAPCLIVANHKTMLDAFTIGAALPSSVILKLMPMAFILHNAFYDSPIRPLAWLAGCFPAKNPKEKRRLYGVNAGIAFLSSGYSMLIFPEGTRVRGARGEARPGIIRIHQAMPHVPFILCHITYPKGIKNRLSGRWRTVTYKLIEKPTYSDPEKVMDDVFAL